MKGFSSALLSCILMTSVGCAQQKSPPSSPPPSAPPVEKPVDKAIAPPAQQAPVAPPVTTAAPPSHADALADDPSAKPTGKDEARILVKWLPLKSDALRLDAIARFSLLYAPYTPNKAILRSIREGVNAAIAGFKVPVTTFSLSMGPDEYIGLLNAPVTRNYLPVLDALAQAVARTKDAILDFRERADGQLDASQRQAIDAQIGSSPTDDSFAFENLTSLRTLARSANFQLCPGVSH